MEITQEIKVCDILLRGILFRTSSQIRNLFQEFIYFLAANIKPASTPISLSPFGEFLDKMLNADVLLNEPECGELCELLILMIDMYVNLDRKEAFMNTEEKFKELIIPFKQYKSKETLKSSESDNVLLGLLHIIEKLLDTQSKLDNTYRFEIINDIFFKCLFPLKEDVSQMYSYKCKTNKSREAAFKLLEKLVEYKEEFVMYLFKECILPLNAFIPKLTVWNYSPEKEEKSSSGFVGIKNLGCICYINSMLQQFFLITPFRDAILAITDNKPSVLNDLGIDDNLLHQFQSLFGYLTLSIRKDYNPSNFCFSYKDVDGKPINTLLQHDAHEFLNIIFDRLERIFKNTPYNLILQSVFGGKSCSQVVCKMCGNISSTYEDYFTLSLEIKNQKSLQDAFERFVADSVVSGYFCSECKKAVDAIKRTLLSTLPNVLIVHLQRFSFNFDTLMNEKVNC